MLIDNAKLYHGDSAEILPTLAENSVDSLISDPPASISFMGQKWDSDKGGRQQWINWLAGIMKECIRTLKPGSHALIWAIPKTSHWTATAVEDAGFEIRDIITHINSQGMPKSININKAMKKAGIENPGWKGWGTALKSCSEHWILARKPFPTTVIENVNQWGTGAINIEASRIPTKDNLNGVAYGNQQDKRDDGWRYHGGGAGEYVQPSGRWPSNLLMSHSEGCTEEQCVEGCAVAELNEQAGHLKSGKQGFKKATAKGYQGNCYGKDNRPEGTPMVCYADEGEASRFFKCFYYAGKASKSEKNLGVEGQNNHSTVKSIKLMSYLIKMISPLGSTILDPFLGSGSTGVAAIENGFKFIGIEKEKEYFDIACQRIKYTYEQFHSRHGTGISTDVGTPCCLGGT